jgi:hypothetical protein
MWQRLMPKKVPLTIGPAEDAAVCGSCLSFILRGEMCAILDKRATCSGCWKTRP